MNQVKVVPAEGRLGILVVGCGAVATTFIGKADRLYDSVRQDPCW